MSNPEDELMSKEEKEGRHDPQEFTGWVSRGARTTVAETRNGRYVTLDNEKHRGLIETILDLFRVDKTE